jgi:DNA-3-methyladenine glycosylase II
MNKNLDRFLIRKATRHLEAADNRLAAVIKKHGPCTIAPAVDNPFHALASSIISQQLSARAARAIKGRLFGLLGRGHFTPDGILKISAKRARSAGLSRAKIDSIRGLALAVRGGGLDLPSLAKGEDEDIITELVSFPGIGRWTAEMFLIFGIGRPDVLSVHDAGLKRGFKVIYNLADTPSPEEMISIGNPWRPYRSVASWYLWRVVD